MRHVAIAHSGISAVQFLWLISASLADRLYSRPTSISTARAR